MSDDDERAEYALWFSRAEPGPTPPLAEYLRWAAYDDNLPWRLGESHLVNLLDQAVEALEAAYGSTNALRETLEAALGEQEEA